MVDRMSLVFDRDYGVYHRKGWTVSINGSVVVELRRFLIVALAMTAYKTIVGQK